MGLRCLFVSHGGKQMDEAEVPRRRLKTKAAVACDGLCTEQVKERREEHFGKGVAPTKKIKRRRKTVAKERASTASKRSRVASAKPRSDTTEMGGGRRKRRRKTLAKERASIGRKRRAASA